MEEASINEIRTRLVTKGVIPRMNTTRNNAILKFQSAAARNAANTVGTTRALDQSLAYSLALENARATSKKIMSVNI